jgi:hypothetical protein
MRELNPTPAQIWCDLLIADIKTTWQYVRKYQDIADHTTEFQQILCARELASYYQRYYQNERARAVTLIAWAPDDDHWRGRKRVLRQVIKKTDAAFRTFWERV